MGFEKYKSVQSHAHDWYRISLNPITHPSEPWLGALHGDQSLGKEGFAEPNGKTSNVKVTKAL